MQEKAKDGASGGQGGEMLAVLEAKNVGLVYESGLIFKKRNMVLQGISLEMKEGRTLGLMGASGSGKTTLGRILAGLERPSSGRVLFGGQDIWSLGRGDFSAMRRQVQMVFQDPESSLNPRKSIERAIHEVLGLLKVPRKEWRERTQEILKTVGLSEELLCRYPAQISGGQCQRLALGRVLLLHPRVMILDEPTSALDISVQAQILNLLQDLQKDMGLAYLLISHQPEVIRFMAHETVRLESGEIS
jgi:peptide/nickel transport system ATP-binding protein